MGHPWRPRAHHRKVPPRCFMVAEDDDQNRIGFHLEEIVVSYITNQWVKMNPFEAAARLNELERENSMLLADLLIEEERSIYWRDNEGKAMTENAALREERDSYRLRAEQNWGLRKEIQSALNVPYDCDGEEALKQGLAAIKTLRADKERMDWLEASDFWPASLDFWPHHLPQVGGSLRAAIDAERKEAQP